MSTLGLDECAAPAKPQQFESRHAVSNCPDIPDNVGVCRPASTPTATRRQAQCDHVAPRTLTSQAVEGSKAIRCPPRSGGRDSRLATADHHPHQARDTRDLSNEVNWTCRGSADPTRRRQRTHVKAAARSPGSHGDDYPSAICPSAQRRTNTAAIGQRAPPIPISLRSGYSGCVNDRSWPVV
jgi:hypothetical protein